MSEQRRRQSKPTRETGLLVLPEPLFTAISLNLARRLFYLIFKYVHVKVQAHNECLNSSRESFNGSYIHETRVGEVMINPFEMSRARS